MRREILFKAKRVDDGEWVEGNVIEDGVTGQTFIHSAGNSVNESDKANEEGCLKFVAFEVEPETLCQYTGKNDENKQKIWENDIVKIHSGYIDEEDGYFIVEWDKDAARYYSINGEGLSVDFDNVYGYECEVIGNIFDNPELLEGGKQIETEKEQKRDALGQAEEL